ncbi:hypothetical protein Dsin_010144 [Dipteronia sinensis]|uniref:Homeobox-leucine zipper protein n=1 Tax=Dipteronia sinensis TaxID=43782 RepID=A0AAE0ECK2_9ROSI|nr:hypothetical protein Dsin_010144 [Dipteronia sinensis]
MAAGREICGSASVTALLRNEKLPCSSSEDLESLWIPTPSSVLHLGPKSLVNFSENVNGGDTKGTLFFQSHDKEDNGLYGDFDGCLNPPGKKRRLTVSQVQFLEKNFDVENKLEPERKLQFAKELGLQPRQVAIWFQNRRARFKSQRLEKEYDALKADYDKLKADYDNLLIEKQALKDQVLLLEDKLLLKTVVELEPQKTVMDDAETKTSLSNLLPMEVACCKQEDASSVKSDVFDYASDSPHYYNNRNGNHSSLMEPADCSQVFEPDQSDFSQDEEDNNPIIRNLLPPPPYFLKLEEDCYYNNDPPPPTPPINSCNFGFSVEDHPLWSWPY